jgi:peptidoglycan/LPS O-acetylase OafA/YrhL
MIVYWTLTYEIQFYLVLAASRWLATRMASAGSSEAIIRATTFYPLAALALVSALLSRDWVLHGLFVNLWYGFFAGVLAYEAGYQRRSPIPLLMLCAILLVVQRDGVFNLPCAVAALILFAAGRTGWLVSGLSARPWQALGRISYSLYLIHVPTMILAFSIWTRVIGRGPVQDLAGLMIVSLILLATATIYWWLIEQPAHKLAMRLWRKPPPLPSEAAVRS